MNNNNINNEAIRNTWNQWASGRDPNYQQQVNRIIKNPQKAFPSKVWDSLCRHFPSFDDINVCVPSSGDNLAAFAFYLLGAKVTSCDISCKQIEKAEKIAQENNWSIDFKVLDSMDLSSLAADSFDLVYTSNGVFVWISDLYVMFAEFHRILKQDGSYIFFETHPFNRPFDDNDNRLKIVKHYNDIHITGKLSNYHWRVHDLVNYLVQSGFRLEYMDELLAEKDTIGATWWNLSEWDNKSDVLQNPYAALPQWISFCCKK